MEKIITSVTASRNDMKPG